MPVACLKCKTVTGFLLYIFSKVFICVHPQYIWSLSPLHVWILLFSIKIICSWHDKKRGTCQSLQDSQRQQNLQRPHLPILFYLLIKKLFFLSEKESANYQNNSTKSLCCLCAKKCYFHCWETLYPELSSYCKFTCSLPPQSSLKFLCS